MKTKIVYSVVSDPSDYYLEQTIMSVYSLRIYNKNCVVYLVTDTITLKNLVGKRAVIRQYVNELVPVPVPGCYTKVQRSRFLKTSLREYIDGDFLFIDSDTLITSNLDEVDKWNFLIGAVADKHVPIAIHPMKKFIYDSSKIVGFKVIDERYYWNSGVFFVKDTDVTRDFYKRWNNLWITNSLKGINSDQASLAKVNEEFDYLIFDIGGIWNCQLTDNGLNYFINSKIIHYFASTAKNQITSPYNFYQNDIYNKIKIEGELPQEVKNIIHDTKQEFNEICRIIAKEDIIFMDSALHHLFLDHKTTYKVILFVARVCLKLFNLNYCCPLKNKCQ